jgi:precorrin-2 dehydrogenase/sirohydrochlorin ferrochelatase
MLPIALNTEKLQVALIGTGAKLHARENKLRELGVKSLSVFQTNFDAIDCSKFDIVLIVGLPINIFTNLHRAAKDAGCLVNVEDEKDYTDFYFQSFVKRGDLLISVSTSGKTPGTAKIIRDKIEEIFPADWANYIDEISAMRTTWKNSGKTYDEVNELTKEFVKNKNWL